MVIVKGGCGGCGKGCGGCGSGNSDIKKVRLVSKALYSYITSVS